MHESEKWKWSHSVVSDSSPPHGLQPTRLLRPWDFPGKSTGVGCHCPLRCWFYHPLYSSLLLLATKSLSLYSDSNVSISCHFTYANTQHPGCWVLELFISSHLHFTHSFCRVFLLSLSGLCYHPDQFYLKNQQLAPLTGVILLGGSFSFLCWTSPLNSLDHPHNFSLSSVLLSLLPSLSYLYSMFCYFEHSC